MTRQRKDDHLYFARKQTPMPSDFTKIQLIHQSLPKYNLSDISLNAHYLGHDFQTPLYINAMTGGSHNGQILNQKLAILAKELHLPMALGSASIILKEPDTIDTFKIVRKENPNGFLIANLGAEHPITHVNKVVELLGADAIQLHLNVMQELIMPEGSREFARWRENLADVLSNSPVPVIIKEVGFGMSQETIHDLIELGATTIDVAGAGGTNFAQIENERRRKPYEELNTWGLTTPLSLLESRNYQDQVTILASGGITNPLDAVKALTLGGQAIGLAGYLLHLLDHQPVEAAIETLANFQTEMKKIMLSMNAQNITELHQAPFVLDDNLLTWCKQRKINL